ncbi:hypothetical protein CH254_18040 [Rhodococcus sp. 06-412-2C]|uniref:recombinase family protein n=1 Tax=unclassified Rhodococcus (in: high G+C Gram-positive bacteria) TaxID=192944 RepID=UPI000B9BCA46|nr:MULTISPECIES: recombinase family protein [unclassified Rhodococcus (in: high G+C Gram-positive bacteria)]OZC86443.1 hypothetical protein CH254_18040 [Rhodococcus sp. 06-412-2C]OZD02143.1 hypothetical protein CH279_04225 [Rhodococcus sp. 06-412-2B]
MNETFKAAIYVRISRDAAGEGLGVQRQLEDCRELADDHGWPVVRVFEDNDISAYSGKNRPGYNALLAAMEAGEVNAVIAYQLDRVGRTMPKLADFIALCAKKEIGLYTVKGGNLDLNTAMGRTWAHVSAAFAQGEVEKMIERMKRAYQQQAVAGKWRPRRRVFGYNADGSALDPLESTAVREAVQSVLNGVSVRSIARQWNTAGLITTGNANKWTSPTVRRILVNPRYAGISTYDGREVGTGTWPTVIDRDQHLAITAYLSDETRRSGTGFERKFHGSGVYVCGKCGAKMVTTTKSGGYRVYKCSAQAHLSRQQAALDDYVSLLVIGRLNRPDARLKLDTPDIDLTAMYARREGLQARQSELATMFAAGTVTGPQLAKATADLTEQLTEVDETIAACTLVNPVAQLVLADDTLESTWDRLEPDTRGKIIDALMTVTVHPSPLGQRKFNPEFIDIEWKKPWKA